MNTCCSLPPLPYTRRDRLVEVLVDPDVALPQLVLEQREAFLDQLVQVEVLEFAAVQACEIQQSVHDLRGPERLLLDLLQDRLAAVRFRVSA